MEYAGVFFPLLAGITVRSGLGWWSVRRANVRNPAPENVLEGLASKPGRRSRAGTVQDIRQKRDQNGKEIKRRRSNVGCRVSVADVHSPCPNMGTPI